MGDAVTLCVPPLHQMLLYLFYVLPFFCLCIYGLLRPGCSWMPDWSLVFAGAVAQVGGLQSQPGGSEKWGGGWTPGPYPHLEQLPEPLPEPDNYFFLGGSDQSG